MSEMKSETDTPDKGRSLVSEFPREPIKIPRMSDDELRKFVLGLCDGSLFTMFDCPQIMIPMVFMPIALGAFAGYVAEDMAEVGCVYEYYSEAGPRSINGLPVFASFKLVHIDDWRRAAKAADAEIARRKDIPI